MTRHEFTPGDWIVCRHFASQMVSGLGPWTVAKVTKVHEASLILSESNQRSSAGLITFKRSTLKHRVAGVFKSRDAALLHWQNLKAAEVAFVQSLNELDAEFARRRAKILSDHLGETL